MKTIKDFINEIDRSDVLKNELKAIREKDELADFLRKNDVDGTAEEFVKTFKAAAEYEGELSDDDASAAAGGDCIIHIVESDDPYAFLSWAECW